MTEGQFHPNIAEGLQSPEHQARRLNAAEFLGGHMFEALDLSKTYCKTLGIIDPSLRAHMVMHMTAEPFTDPTFVAEKLMDYGQHRQMYPDFEEYVRLITVHSYTLTSNAVLDSTWLASSAYDFLANHHPMIKQRPALERSTGLLLASSTDQDGIYALKSLFGEPIQPGFLRLAGTQNKRTVGFSEEAQQEIKNRPSKKGGCPAFKLNDPFGSDKNMQIAYWRRFVNVVYS